MWVWNLLVTGTPPVNGEEIARTDQGIAYGYLYRWRQANIPEI
jgi:hypothetical protein